VVSGHVDGLLSAAYDGELGEDARAEFDRHLAECSSCAAAFAELTTAVDALRELGPARMPRPVRLPEGSPAPQRRLAGLFVRPAWWRGWATGLTAVGAVAVAGVAAAVVLVNLHGGVAGPSRNYAAALAPAASGAALQGGDNLSSGSLCLNCTAAGQPVPQAVIGSQSACSAQPLGTGAAAAAQVPAGFSNQITNDDGSVRVVIATQASSFAPGGTVYIYARLIDDSGGEVYLPCTDLAGPEPAVSGGAANASGAETSATPEGQLVYEGQPVLQATLPLAAQPGETYEVVVQVPAVGGEAQARQVSLAILVS
jgi:hypothetical protein